MTMKHMTRTPEELRDDTALIFMITMTYLTAPPPDPEGWSWKQQLWVAARANDRRWSSGYRWDKQVLDLDHWATLSATTFDI